MRRVYGGIKEGNSRQLKQFQINSPFSKNIKFNPAHTYNPPCFYPQFTVRQAAVCSLNFFSPLRSLFLFILFYFFSMNIYYNIYKLHTHTINHRIGAGKILRMGYIVHPFSALYRKFYNKLRKRNDRALPLFIF